MCDELPDLMAPATSAQMLQIPQKSADSSRKTAAKTKQEEAAKKKQGKPKTAAKKKQGKPKTRKTYRKEFLGFESPGPSGHLLVSYIYFQLPNYFHAVIFGESEGAHK